MTYTSAQAAKLLAKLQQEHTRLSCHEEQAKTFVASVGEDVESVRPDYDYEKTREELASLEAAIRTVKHAVNVFNATTVVPGFTMTVDEMLVYLPQLTKRKSKLKEMVDTLPKARENGYSRNNFIDYRYINYDLEAVKADLDAVTEELAKAQLALDEVNHTLTFEIDV